MTDGAAAPTALDALLADPWAALRLVVGDPLHPGGADATERLLDRAGVGPDTTLLDVGCGAGDALVLSGNRGARAIGLDRDPSEGAAPRAVKGDLTAVPVATGSVDVVLAECVLCLADDLDAALAEARRLLVPGGRLALSDVVVAGPVPDLPAPVARALCLTDRESREGLAARLEAAGFAVDGVHDHREDLLAMRDRAREAVSDLPTEAFGERGRRLLTAFDDLEAALEDGRVGYVSTVATVEPRA